MSNRYTGLSIPTAISVFAMDADDYLGRLLRIADHRVLPRRLEGWKKVIRWSVDGDEIFWTTENGTLAPIKKSDPGFRVPDFTLTTTVNTLHKIVKDALSLSAIAG